MPESSQRVSERCEEMNLGIKNGSGDWQGHHGYCHGDSR